MRRCDPHRVVKTAGFKPDAAPQDYRGANRAFNDIRDPVRDVLLIEAAEELARDLKRKSVTLPKVSW